MSRQQFTLPQFPLYEGKVNFGVFAEDILRGIADRERTRFECPIALTGLEVQDELNKAATLAVGVDAYDPDEAVPVISLNERIQFLQGCRRLH